MRITNYCTKNNLSGPLVSLIVNAFTEVYLGSSRTFIRGSEFLSYEIKLQNQVMQNHVTLRVTNSKFLYNFLFRVANSTS